MSQGILTQDSGSLHNQGVFQTIGDENRPDFMLASVEAWRSEDIYVTKCVKSVKEKISSKGCVSAIGVPGAGKSTALHHAALSLETEGFIIYYISGPEEFLKYYDINKKQVFVLDDALGVYSVNQDDIKLLGKLSDKVKNALGANTKLLVSIRTLIFKSEMIKNKNIVFLDKSEATCHVDFSDADFKLGIDDMRAMLTHCMRNKRINRDVIKDLCNEIWPFTEKQIAEENSLGLNQLNRSFYSVGDEFSQCFPLLCKVFVNNDFFNQNHPRAFFENPFQALTKVFQNIRTDNKQDFCALVLCTMFDGTLTDDMISPLSESPLDLCETKHKIDKDKIEMRNYIMSTYKLKCPDDLEDLQSALNSLTGVYVVHTGDTYKISHRVFHDIVTYVYNDPLFVFKYGTREFIRERVRLNEDEKEHDPYVIVYSDNKNIERLADRLFRDLKTDLVSGARFIARNPNIHDDRLLSFLRVRLYEKEHKDKTLIDEIFKQCMLSLLHNSVMYKHGDVTQHKLIELCLQAEVDCNMVVDIWCPLHFSVRTGSLKLTKLLMDNGADKRRDSNILISICKFTKCNKSELIKLLTKHGGDNSVVEFITNDRHRMLEDLKDYGDNIQLEEVLFDNSVKVLTTNKNKVRHYVEHNKGELQLVKRLHNNVLTCLDVFGCNILHHSANDFDLTKTIFKLFNSTQLRKALKQRDSHYRTPFWFVMNSKKPFIFGETENVVVEEQEDMIKLYKKHGAIW